VEKREKVAASLEELGRHPEPDDHAAGMRHLVRHSRLHLEADLAWIEGILSELDGK
jgi:hypothetical protein